MRKGFLRRVKEREERRKLAFHKILEEMKGREIAIVLFGSRARGDCSASSDFDILAIVKDENVAKELKESLKREKIPSDLHVYYFEEAKKLLPFSSILLDALQEGVLLIDGIGIHDLLLEAAELRKKGLGRVKGGWKIAVE